MQTKTELFISLSGRGCAQQAGGRQSPGGRSAQVVLGFAALLVAQSARALLEHSL